MFYNTYEITEKASFRVMKNRQILYWLFLLIALLLLSLVIPIRSDASSISELQSEIDALEEKNSALQAEIDAIQSQYDTTYGEMSDLVAKKNTIDQEISLLNEKIATTNEQITAYKQLIADTQDELDIAQFTLNGLSEMHRERIRAMEENGSISYWEVIFKANSFTDLLDRMNIMQEISEADQKRMEELRIAADLVTANQMNLENEKANLEIILEELTADEELLQQRRTESDDLLRELAKEAEEYELLLEESEDLQDALMQEIAAKEAELKEAEYNAYLAELAKAGDNPPSGCNLDHTCFRIHPDQSVWYAYPSDTGL